MPDFSGWTLNARSSGLRTKSRLVCQSNSPVVVTDMIMDGNLGQPFMSQYVITFDLVNGRLWIALNWLAFLIRAD
jgi:hypothetical protein